MIRFQKTILSILTLLICFLFLSCRSNHTVNRFTYLSSELSLSVSGTVTFFHHDNSSIISNIAKTRKDMPIEFSANVHLSPLNPGEVSDHAGNISQAWQMTVFYTAPKYLKGMTVSCIYTPSVTNDETPVKLKIKDILYDQEFTCSFSSVSCLLYPAILLFPTGDMVSVSPKKDGQQTYLYHTASLERSLTFDQKFMHPIKIIEKNQSFEYLIIIKTTEAP